MIKYLYHGTCLAYYENIKNEGIKPRILTRVKGNWETGKSNENIIHLASTKEEAWFHAKNSSSQNKNARKVIIQIDFTKLDKDKLTTDENYLYMAEKYTQEYNYYVTKSHLNKNWRNSLREVKYCGYLDIIPTDLFLKVEFIDGDLYNCYR